MKQTNKEDLYYEHYELHASEDSINDYQILLDDFINYCIKNNINDEEEIKIKYKEKFTTDCDVLWYIKKEINKRNV